MITLKKRRLNFTNKFKIKNPKVIYRNSDVNGNPTFDSKQIAGEFYRVFPINEHEVNYIEGLAHQSDKFAPSEGNGILVKKAMIDMVADQA
jgi:hypothetical protein